MTDFIVQAELAEERREGRERRREMEKQMVEMGKQITSLESVSEETQRQVGALNDTVHMVDSKVDGLTSVVSELKGELGVLNKKSFDWPEFWSGVMTPRGMFLSSVAMICMTVVLLSVAAPETIEAFMNGIALWKVK